MGIITFECDMCRRIFDAKQLHEVYDDDYLVTKTGEALLCNKCYTKFNIKSEVYEQRKQSKELTSRIRVLKEEVDKHNREIKNILKNR